MHNHRQLLAAFGCLAALSLFTLPVQATSSTAVRACSTDRYGVEQCTIPLASGDKIQPEQCDQDCRNATAKARLQRYCAEQKKAGKSSADGLCVGQAAGD
jgi:hypothetical protein